MPRKRAEAGRILEIGREGETWGRKGSLRRDSLPNQREVPGLYIYGPRGAVKELVYCLGASSQAPRS